MAFPHNGFIEAALFNTGSGVTLMTYNFAVPQVPATTNSTSIVQWGGLQDTGLTVVLQPIILYDHGAWKMFVEYFTGSGIFTSTVYPVSVGSVLTCTLSFTGMVGPNYGYTATISDGINLSSLNIISGNPLTTPTFAMEANNILTCSDYPASGSTNFYNISVQNGLTYTTLSWSTILYYPDCDIHIGIVSFTNPGGSLTLYYAFLPPVITSPTAASGVQGSGFTYNITATNSPTSYSATGLPAGLSVNTSTGVISGTPTVNGTFSVTIGATNTAGSGGSPLSLFISPPSTPSTTAPTIPTSSISLMMFTPFQYLYQGLQSTNNKLFQVLNLIQGYLQNLYAFIATINNANFYFVANETGANDAIAANSSAALVPGLTLQILLAHTLTSGANTMQYNNAAAIAIKSSRNPAGNIIVPYAVGGIITLCYNGQVWLDTSQ